MKLLKTMFVGEPFFDKLIEGKYAHEYKDTITRDEITVTYNKRYKPKPDPLSHPERFDPLNPPAGWAYDPYYEIWIRTDES